MQNRKPGPSGSLIPASIRGSYESPQTGREWRILYQSVQDFHVNAIALENQQIVEFRSTIDFLSAPPQRGGD